MHIHLNGDCYGCWEKFTLDAFATSATLSAWPYLEARRFQPASLEPAMKGGYTHPRIIVVQQYHAYHLFNVISRGDGADPSQPLCASVNAVAGSSRSQVLVGNTLHDMYLASEAIRFLPKDKANDLQNRKSRSWRLQKVSPATKFIPY
jgi:hypothetical protein